MTHQITIAHTAHQCSAEPGQSLLDAALSADILLPHECRSGGCGTCRVRILAGEVRYPDDELPFGLDEAEVTAGYALACQAIPLSPVMIEAPEGLQVAQPVQRHSGEVVRVAEVADGVFHLVVALGNEVAFWPGQYANIIGDDGAKRSFSMASIPRGREIDFYIRRLPGGAFTDHRLADLHAGDKLVLDLPLGRFRLHAEDYRPLLLIALEATRGNQIKAAHLLGLNRNTLRKKIKDLDIPVVRGMK